MEKRKKVSKYAQEIVRIVGVILIITMLIVCSILPISADTSWYELARVAGTSTKILGYNYSELYSSMDVVDQSLPEFTGEFETSGYIYNSSWETMSSRGTDTGEFTIELRTYFEYQANIDMSIGTFDTYIEPLQEDVVYLYTYWYTYNGVVPMNTSSIVGSFYTNGSEMEYEFEYEPIEFYEETYDTTGYKYFLNFYWILLNSNIDWELYVPDDIPATEFYNEIQNLTYENIIDPLNEEKLESLFKEIEILYVPYAGMHTSGDIIRGYEETDTFVYVVRGNQKYYRSEDLYELRNIDIVYNGILWDSPNAITLWLGRAVSGFMDVEIMPFFSFGGLIVIIITFSLVLWWLKVFAGG